MAGGASADPPPAWLIVLTMATFLSFFIAYNDTLPNIFPTHCSTTQDANGNCSGGSFTCTAAALYLNCVSSAVTAIVNIFIILFTIITLGGVNSPLPTIIQIPLLFFFAITWGIIIVKMITNTAGAVIP